MCEITAWTDYSKTVLTVKSDEEAMQIKQRVLSQMNNGHTVVIGNTLINPAHIRIVDFKFKEATND